MRPASVTAIPAPLRALDRWLVWRAEARAGKATKVPYRSNAPRLKASSTDCATFSTWDAALRAAGDATNGLDGIGLALSPPPVPAGAVALVAIDGDDCRDPETGAIAPAFLEAIAPLRGLAYAEVSPSGRGVHVLAFGPTPPRSAWRVPGTLKVEAWGHGRYVTMTGDVLPGWETIAGDASEAVAEAWSRLEAYASRPATNAPAARPAASRRVKPAAAPASGGYLSADHALRRALGSARVRALYRGDLASVGGDHSRGDLHLCCALYRFGASPADVDALFRDSALYREKWDRGARQGETYGEGTIREAIALVEASGGPIAEETWEPIGLHTDAAPEVEEEPWDDAGDDPVALRARIRYLEGELAHARAYRRAVERVLAIPTAELSASHKVATIAAAGIVERKTAQRVKAHARAHGLDPASVPADVVAAIATEPAITYRSEVARATGLSEDGAARVLKGLGEAGLLHVETRAYAASPETGEITGRPEYRLEVALLRDPETGAVTNVLDAAAAFRRPETEKRQQGGKRIARAAVCPLHPEADAICRDCATEAAPEAVAAIDAALERVPGRLEALVRADRPEAGDVATAAAAAIASSRQPTIRLGGRAQVAAAPRGDAGDTGAVAQGGTPQLAALEDTGGVEGGTLQVAATPPDNPVERARRYYAERIAAEAAAADPPPPCPLFPAVARL